MSKDNNVPVDFIDEDEMTEEELEVVLAEAEAHQAFDDSDDVREQ